MGYLANFMVYTFAMVGIIAVALLVFKASTSGGKYGKSKHLKVIDTLTIGARKTLYIISTGRENFLIAGDVDKTTLISKLETPKFQETETISDIVSTVQAEDCSTKSFQETISALPKSNYIDKSNIGIKSSMLNNSENSQYTSVMKNLAAKMRN